MTIPPVTPRTRSIWPWIIGGGAALVLLGIGIALGVLLLAAGQKEADTEEVERVVLQFDESYEDSDCDQFIEITSDDFRDEFFDGDFDCEVWEEIGDKYYDENGDYQYDVQINEITVRGDRATVETSETYEYDATTGSSEITYKLEREKGRWLIVDFKEEVTETTESQPEPEASEEPDELTADEVVAEDLKNAKAALLAYYLVEDGWAGVTEQELEVYGYGASLGTINMMFYIDAAQEEATYCIDATASETGNSFWIRPDTVAKPGLCSDPVE
jgi:hypothetical protein